MKQVKAEIVSDFYIGTTDMLLSEKMQPKSPNSIKKFINLEQDLNFVGKWKEYTNPQHKNTVQFNEKRNLITYQISITDTIHSSLLNDESIFICCNTCNQLSPLVAIAFLLRYGNLNFKNALRSVISKLPQSPFQPSIEHMDILKTFL